MKPIKIIAIILCAAMLFAILAGCGNPTQDERTPPEDSPSVAPSDPPTQTEDPSNLEPPQGIDFVSAFATFAPDTVMMTVGDYNVTWAELFFRLFGVVDSMIANLGGIPDFSEFALDGVSFADLAMDSAIENILLFRAVDYGATLSGVTLGEEDYALLQQDINMAFETYGGEEAFLEILWEYDGISSIELYEYLVRISYLASRTFEALYGSDGALLSDEEAEALTAFDGYLMAKHILILKTDDDDDEPLNAIEEILELLNDFVGDDDDFDALFDTLMYDYSEDGGLMSNPYGYLFQYGDMLSEFYDACVSLEIGDFSGIVETIYGYHIIYRLPINYDTIPVAFANEGEFSTLRYAAAAGMFDVVLYEWIELLTPEYTADFELVDIALLFR